jgi:hypothetical protein
MRSPLFVPLQPSSHGQLVPADPQINSVRSVYLGGNITRNDWRRTLVAGLTIQGVAPEGPADPSSLWPVLPAAVMHRFDYVGPYSISGDGADDVEWNGEASEEGDEWIVSGPLYGPQRGPRVIQSPADPYYGQPHHTQPDLSNTSASQEVWWPLVRTARQVQNLVVQALYRADLYFTWIDTPMCAATLTEVGLARSLGKIIWIAGPQAFDELWLAYTLADHYTFRYPVPAQAFYNLLEQTLSSGMKRAESQSYSPPPFSAVKTAGVSGYR